MDPHIFVEILRDPNVYLPAKLCVLSSKFPSRVQQQTGYIMKRTKKHYSSCTYQYPNLPSPSLTYLTEKLNTGTPMA